MPNPFRKVRFVIASAAVTALCACSSDDKSIVDPKIETVKMCRTSSTAGTISLLR